MNTFELHTRWRYNGLRDADAIRQRVLEVLSAAGMTETDIEVWMITPNPNIVNSIRADSPEYFLTQAWRGQTAGLSVLDEAEHHASTWIPAT